MAKKATTKKPAKAAGKKASKKTTSKKGEKSAVALRPELREQEGQAHLPENVSWLINQWDTAKDKQRVAENILYATLSGEHQRKVRQEVMKFLTGQDLPQTACTIHALEPILLEFFHHRGILANPPAEQVINTVVSQPLALQGGEATNAASNGKQAASELNIDHELTEELKKVETPAQFDVLWEKVKAAGMQIVTLKGPVMTAYAHLPAVEGKPATMNYNGHKALFIYLTKRYFVVAAK